MAKRIREPLERFNVLRTRDPDELRARLLPLYAVSKLDLPRGKARFDATFNHYKLGGIALSFARYGAPIQLAMSNTDFFTQGFGIRGYGEAVSEGKFFTVAGGKGGAAGPGASAVLDYRAGFEHLFVRIPPEALNRKLSALLGSPLGQPLKLRGEFDPSALAAEYRLVKFVIAELDRSTDPLPEACLAEFDQALIIAYLFANLSNYSELLNRKSPAVAPWQVRRALDYIEANWDRPITIEALAQETGSSARGLFATFRKHRGCSPMAFVRHVRLTKARDILLAAGSNTSVSSIAASCGFGNLGHFAKRYLARFGELPSETLKRAKHR